MDKESAVDREEAMTAVREAMELSMQIEESLDGEDLLIIIMALTKTCGVMLAEAKGMHPFFVDEATAIDWIKGGISKAYRAHLAIITPTDGNVH